MLDVHPPHHATHAWRDFFIHIATITVGLLIAIGLERSVEALHQRHQRRELEQQLHDEAQRNLDLVRGNILRFKAQSAWLNSAVVALNSAPVTNGQIKRSTLSFQSIPGGSIWDPSRTVWAVAKASGAVALLPEDEAQVYARVDFEGEQLQTGEEEMNRAVAALGGLIKSWRGLPPAQLEYFSIAQRDAVIQVLTLFATQLDHMLDLELVESGACRGVLNGARSVDDLRPYIQGEAKQFATAK
jgi:hypothetical protein